ncbi:MAG: VanZ family protein [Armatimonadetes bacterium]|nr:VanZ family protein [Armatimonadota bacterium]
MSHHKLVWLLPAFLEMAVIYYLSSQSALPALPSLLDWDKLQHATAYGALAGLIRFGLIRGYDVSHGRASLLGLAGAALYGLTDEAHQGFVPGRRLDIRDWIADVVGAIIVVLAFQLGKHLSSIGKDKQDVRI